MIKKRDSHAAKKRNKKLMRKYARYAEMIDFDSLEPPLELKGVGIRKSS